MTAIAPTLPLTTCPECSQPVLRLYTTAQKPVVLDATEVPSGLYGIDAQHRAARRSIVQLYREQAGLAPATPGREPHVCDPDAAARWWDR